MPLYQFLTIVFFVTVTISCKQQSDAGEQFPDERNLQILAEVYGKELSLDELLSKQSFPASVQDSIEFLKKNVNNWVKEQLFLRRAEAHYETDPEIENLVKEYRESLIQHSYEEHLIRTALDTVVTDFDLKSHYEDNKTQYSLEKSIVRCLYVKVRKPVRQRANIEEWMEYPSERNLQYLRKYCMNNANYCLINPRKWYKWDDIKDVFPNEFSGLKIEKGLQRSYADFTYHYFIDILDYVSKKEDAPITYFEERAKKLIIRQRKNRLLDDLKDAFFEKEKAGRNVKIFVE